jgi:hypothetical protein
MESWARIQGTPMQPTLCILLGTSLALHVIGSCRRTTRQSCTDEGSSGPAATEDLALTRIAKTLRILKLSRLLKVVRAFRYYSSRSRRHIDAAIPRIPFSLFTLPTRFRRRPYPCKQGIMMGSSLGSIPTHPKRNGIGSWACM